MTTGAGSHALKGLSSARAVWLATLAVVGAGLAGCGADASPADDFVGTWLYDYAQTKSTVQCLNSDPLDQPPAPNKTFGRGVSAPLVDLSVSPLDSAVFCDFEFDVAGPVATIKAGQTCTLTGGDTLTIDEWTFTQVNSPTTAEELVDGTIHLTLPTPTGPQEETCAWSLVAHLTRIAKE